MRNILASKSNRRKKILEKINSTSIEVNIGGNGIEARCKRPPDKLKLQIKS